MVSILNERGFWSLVTNFMLARMVSNLTRRLICVLKDSLTLLLKYPRRLCPADMGIVNPVCERVVNMGIGLELWEVI